MNGFEKHLKRISKKADGCWTWLGATGPASGGGSYGYIWDGEKKRNTTAHRVFYERFVGPIPRGLHLDHLCRNQLCVNPKHLEPVTPKENVLRGDGLTAKNARKTHCLKGHALKGANLHPNKNGWRVCKACRVLHKREVNDQLMAERHARGLLRKKK